MRRREFLASGAAAMVVGAMPVLAASVKQFKLGVITDEVTQDFEKALVWVKGFGLEWVELRFVWGKYVIDFNADDVKRAKELLAKYGMRVSVVDSPYFKTLLPGTQSKFEDSKGDPLQSAYAQQQAVLERAMARAKDFGTQKVRIFSFLRVTEPKAVFDRVAKELEKTSEIAKREGIHLVLENEFTCNVATGVESAAMLDAVKSPALGLNWDPGNAYAAGELKPYPDGYKPLGKSRLWHMHLKDAEEKPKGEETVWRPIGGGKIDYLGQFGALLKDGYEGTMSLETHYLNAAKDKEASSRESMEGLLKVIREA
jgi:sugar phosphate isomerase/epimerase